jgi:glycosidase
MTNKFIKLSLFAMSALVLGGCSDGDMVMPENPDQPVVSGVGNTMVIYEANPRSFAENNCLSALTARLGDIQQTGANVLWVMPVCTPGEQDAFGSPYCIKDFTSINERYGTTADFQALVSAAHSRGMRVILDWVANHTSWDNPWISAHKDWYQQDDNGNIVNANGWTDVAQLNYDNSEMRSAMISAMLYWVRDMKVDGFRIDYADGVPHDFWKDAIAQIRQQDADAIMLAESSDVAFYEDGFDMIYGWTFSSALTDLFAGKIAPAKFFTQSAAEMANVPSGKQIMRYALNHDVAAENNIATLYGSRQAVEAAYVLASMVDGVPMIYSEQESTFESGTLSFFTYNPLTWDAARAAAYAKLGSIYSSTSEVRGGELRTYQNGKVATFARVTPDHALIVLVNTTGDELTAKTPVSYAGESVTDLLTGATSTLPQSITLGGYDYAIYYK